MAPYADGFRSELARLGYAPGSAENVLRRVMCRLSRWLEAGGVDLGGFDSRQVEGFLAAMRASGQRRVPTARTLQPLLGWLRGLGVMPPASRSGPSTPLEGLLERYERWMVCERGLAARTVDRYQATARRFLAGRPWEAGAAATLDLSGGDVTGFLLGECERLGVGSAKGRVTELRSLLRFLYVEGVTQVALADAVPAVAGWRDTALPAATLTPVQVRALLDGCDRTRATGRRDFAVLTLLARLGLRAAEVAGLQLEDLDWRAGQITVRGKGRRDSLLPLPSDVGEALAAYLVDGRPAVARQQCAAVFVTCYAPLRAMHPTTVSTVVVRACERAGIVPVVRAHQLRHALAGELLAHGADLIDIGQVLGQRDLATTAVYAKVDHTRLRRVARRWPGGDR